ncbi:MAG: prepilin-type N-terminal cleavage/methylation domain-containing protein [Verrucomicrobiota bacterium]
MPHEPLIATGFRRPRGAFSLVELLVAMAVLMLLIALITQLFNSAQAVIGLGNKHMDADAQARALFDRMAIDFGQMVKRPDVACFLKSSTEGRDQSGQVIYPKQLQPGNDQLAFYSQVPGFYPSSGSQSPVSVVAYRVNADATTNPNPSFNKLQRLGAGLVWNGQNTADTPLVFGETTGGVNTIVAKWPSATTSGADANYELAGPQVFRMEYYYVLKGSASLDVSGTPLPSMLSTTPWDVRAPLNHTSINGLRDVAAIGVMIAIIDPKSQVLVSPSQLTALQKTMGDFPDNPTLNSPCDLEAQWQSAIDTSGIPHSAASGIRICRRWFSLSSPSPIYP